MNKLLIGTAMGMAAGMSLMMTSAGRMIRKDVRIGKSKLRKMMRQMERM